MIYEPTMGFLEIHITYICNVACNNCLSLSPQAPTKRDQDFTVADMERLFAESVACDYPWTWLKLHGGEPTLHPYFLDFCRLFYEYKRGHNPRVRISVVSNDSHPERIAQAENFGLDGLISSKVRDNTDKWGNRLPYVPVNVSPVDLGLEPTMGCLTPVDCGIALNNLGFWPCGPSAAAARVFGYEAPVKHVQDLTPDRLKTLYKHCDHCGYAMKAPHSFEQATSPTWASKLKAYNAKDRQGDPSPHC